MIIKVHNLRESDSCYASIMIKKFIILFFLLTLNNCGGPGSAFLGPVFTGATTKSVTRAGISYGSNQIIKTSKFIDKKQK